MKKWLLFVVVAMLVAISFFAAVKKTHKELPIYGQVPAFEFQDQAGKSFSSGELSNRVWVAGFIFTRCMGPCPIISAKMAELKKRLSYASNFSLVSFSVDPEHDSSEKLAEYALKFQNTGKPQWHFLTGAKDRVYELAIKTFMQTASDDATQPDVQARFMHGTRVSLVDDQGRIRGFYNILEVDGVNQLEQDIRSIL